MAKQFKSRTSRRTSTQSKKKTKTTPAKRALKQRKVTGTVLKILKGRPTDERLSAEEAFGDPQQAVEQVLYAESHGSTKELRLVRLAFRQYQGRRFRLK